MRALAPALLGLMLLLPLAQAHEAGFQHVNPRGGSLPPGTVETYELEFEEGPFEAGWVFLVTAVVSEGSAPIGIELLLQNRTVVGNWTVPPDRVTHHYTGLMPQTGNYSLAIRNPGPGAVRFAFYYDQSCNCAGKPIPFEIERGMVVFNADTKAGSTWKATFPEPKAHQLRVHLTTRTDERSRYPQDFAPLQSSDTAVVKDVGAGPVRLHELTWTSPQDQRAYFFVQSTLTNHSAYNLRDPATILPAVMVTPYFEQLGAGPAKTPLGPEALLLALAGAALLARLRR